MIAYLQGIDEGARGAVIQELTPLLRDLTESCPHNLVQQVDALIDEHRNHVGVNELRDKVTQRQVPGATGRQPEGEGRGQNGILLVSK